MKILIADDHPLIRSGVASVLALGGFEITASVADGAAALAAIEETRPDIVLLDVRMPTMGGIEVMRQLRDAGDEIKVVLLTADIEDEQLLDAFRFNVRGILFKDGAEDRLIECLDQVGRGQRYIDRQLIDRALEVSTRVTHDPLGELAPREREVALLVAQGLRNREIAENLTITEGTVKVYLNAIYNKLAVRNRTGLALLVNGHGRQA